MRRLFFVLALFSFSLQACNAQNGASIVSSHGYNNCIQLKNNTTRVVIDPNAGGRVLVYELNGVDVIQQDPRHNGWTTEVSPMPEGHLVEGGSTLDLRLLNPIPTCFSSARGLPK
jgi:hypothetical protein